jgi:WXG100 family type VII secretion target
MKSIFSKKMYKIHRKMLQATISYDRIYKTNKKENVMARIKLTPEELRASAQRYTDGAENVNQVLSSLTNEQAIISENWEGSAFQSFEEQFNELSPKIKEFAQLLQDINAQLVKVADIVEQTDQDIAAQIH